MTTARIAVTLICLPLLFVAYTAIACLGITTGAAQWREAGAQIVIAQEETKQAEIEWSARTEIAAIEADVAKKTSVAFVAFWLLRAITWFATIAAIIIAALVAYIKLFARP